MAGWVDNLLGYMMGDEDTDCVDMRNNIRGNRITRLKYRLGWEYEEWR